MAAPISARRDGANFVACTGPDVCKTPMGPNMVPIPYMSIAFYGSAIRTTRKVKNNGKNDFTLNSRSSTTIGHEPGVGKGVKVAGYKKHSFAKKGSKSVNSHGFAVVRDADPGQMNKPSPGGTEPRRKKSKKTIRHV